MGLNMVTRLARGGHQVVALTTATPAATSRAEAAGAHGAADLGALLSAPAPSSRVGDGAGRRADGN